jgi:hypothetical protein
MTKQFFFLRLFFSMVLLTSSCCFATLSHAERVSYDTETEIAIAGYLAYGQLRSSTSTFLHVTQTSTSIKVTVLIPIGNIAVNIVNGNGEIVYAGQIDASRVGEVLIDISGLRMGIYTIVFTNNQGESLYGIFQI